MNTIADIVQDPQLAANGYFQPQFDDVLQKEMTFPGPPYRLSRTPARRGGTAPRLGEHNGDILSSEPGHADRRAEAAYGGRV